MYHWAVGYDPPIPLECHRGTFHRAEIAGRCDEAAHALQQVIKHAHPHALYIFIQYQEREAHKPAILAWDR